MIQKHYKRMRDVFFRAKKKTKQFLDNRSFTNEEWASLQWKNIQERKGRRILFARALFLIVLWKDKVFIGAEKSILWITIQSKKWFQSVQKWYRRCKAGSEYTKRDLLFFFCIACFFGIGVKMLAIQKITIGFEDYTLVSKSSLYDMNEIRNDINPVSKSASEKNIPQGKTCSDDDNLE